MLRNIQRLFLLPKVEERKAVGLFKNKLYIWELGDIADEKLFTCDELYILYLAAIRSFILCAFIWILFFFFNILGSSVDIFGYQLGGENFKEIKDSFVDYTKISALGILLLIIPYHAALYRVLTNPRKDELSAWDGLKSKPKRLVGIKGVVHGLLGIILCFAAMYYAADVFVFFKNRVKSIPDVPFYLFSSVIVAYVVPAISRMSLVFLVLVWCVSFNNTPNT